MSAKTANSRSKKYGSQDQLELTAHQRQLGRKREDISFFLLSKFLSVWMRAFRRVFIQTELNLTNLFPHWLNWLTLVALFQSKNKHFDASGDNLLKIDTTMYESLI